MEICEFCGERDATSGATAVHQKYGILVQVSCWDCKDKAAQRIREKYAEMEKRDALKRHQLLQ